MHHRYTSGLLYVGLLFTLAACQPVTSRPELPVLVEHKIPTHSAHAGGITVGSDGALWFAETGANQIGRISVDGAVTEYPVPTEDGMEDGQSIVGLGPDGAIWFSEDRANKLGRIALDGTITEYDLPQGMAPIAEIVAGADGALWVTAVGANAIVKLGTDGKVLAEYPLPTPNSLPAGMVAGPDGAFWFMEKTANQVGRITPEGAITEYPIPTANSTPIRLTVGPDNALWFNMIAANKIGRISLAGEITEYNAAGMGPLGLAAGADGAIWFTGYNSTEIGRLTTDGVLTKLSIPTYAAVPYRMVAGPDGNLWFTEQQGNQVGQIKLPAAATAQQKPASAPQTFSPPTFKLPLSVSAGPDWHIKYNLPIRFAIDSPQGNLSLYIVTDAKLADPIDGHLEPFPADFVSWIKSDPDFDAVESTSVTVAGIEGVQIDATPIWKSTTTHLKLFLSLGGAGWEYRENIVNDPEQWRFILLDDVQGERVLILLISERGQFEDAVKQAQQVLDTVVFSERAATQ